MAKFYGHIGFASVEETSPGVYTDSNIIEKPYTGDVLNYTRRQANSGEINDNIVINNRISIICDAFANNNFHSMRYIVFQGAKWKISSIEAKYPRLILNFGELYND